MRLLERALADVPSRFGAGDLRPVEHALHAVHGARDRTNAALQGGSYRPPRNGDDLARFRELDHAFHEELELFAGFAARSEIARAAESYGRVLRACNGCHERFR
jgi:hypothetical protein